MTPNRRLIAQYSDVYRPIIDTYLCRTHVYPVIRVLIYKSVHTWSQQPNVTPNLRQRMLHRSMCIRRRENAIELSRILFEHRATSTSRADDNPQGRRFRWSNQWGRNKSSQKYSRFFQQTGIDKFLWWNHLYTVRNYKVSLEKLLAYKN